MFRMILIFTLMYLAPVGSFFIPMESQAAQEVKIGLRAHRGADHSINKWQATADYLNQRIPDYKFVLVPYEINSQLDQAVSRAEFDFVLTNPSSHVEHRIRYGATPIATLINKRKGNAYTRFGSVIFTRADRADINSLQDLKGKSFMAVDEKGFGGWRVAWRELLKNNVNPLKDFKPLSFGGGLQQNVVYAIRDGKADAGSVRTDMLERMAQRGEIRLETFKVLASKKTDNFAFVHSTPLYPEWPFAKLRHTPDNLARQVATALYSIPATSTAAKNGKYVGWTVPSDYQPVVDLLQELQVGPFMAGPLNLKQVLEQYWPYTLTFTAIFIAAVITIIVVSGTNKQLQNTKDSLEQEVNERKKAQLALRNHQKRLEDMVAERTNALEMSNKELESYSYSIAHDLRTPLRSIVGFSQIVKEDAAVKLNIEEKEYLDRVVAAGIHMAELIDSILELSRISRMQTEKVAVDLSAVSHQIVKQLRSQADAPPISWQIAEHLPVYGDLYLLTILMQNLLENAEKFTRTVANATVEVGGMEDDNSDTVYFVRDNGIGFNLADKEKIFMPFQRAHGDEVEGTGIGLASVHRIVQRHGGRIWVEDNPDRQGVCFYFTLSNYCKLPKLSA